MYHLKRGQKIADVPKKTEELNCFHNSLTSLEGISTLHNLQALRCHGNSLASLKEISTLHNLQTLNCSYSLTSLEGISTLHNLQILYCSHNSLTSLEGISTLHNLRTLWCSYNSLTSLEGISTLHNLQILYCTSNVLQSFKHIPENVKFFGVKNNPIEYSYRTGGSSEKIHEPSGTPKFLKLLESTSDPMSYVKFMRKENLLKLYLFF